MKSRRAVTLVLTPVFVVLAMLTTLITGGRQVFAANSDFEITDGVLTNYRGTGGAVTIPSGKVTAIADQAFYGCGNITSLTVPEGVRTIGAKAFFNCSGMTSISLPTSVKSIGELSFEGCAKLQSITVPAGSGYFCTEDGVLFNSEKNLLIRYPQGKTAASYTVPGSVTVIDKNAFASCLSLTKITLPTGLRQIRDNAFNGDSGLTSLKIPSAVTSIGSGAFRSASGVRTLVMEAKTPSIASGAFTGTGILRILYAGSTTQWVDANMSDVFGTSVKVYYEMTGFDVDDDVLLSYTGSAGSVSVPGFIVKIGSSAFRDRNSMKSITLPTSLKTIGQSAFDGCTSLERITIPSSVTSIEKWAFDNCKSLLKISVASENKYYSASGGVLYNRDKSELLRCPPALGNSSFTVPSSVEKIGDSAFSICSGLTTVSLPDSVVTLDPYAFDQCAGITEITIPVSVRTIGKYAFRSNKKLSTVTLNAVSPTVGSGAFQNAPVTQVFYAGSQTQWNTAKLGDAFGSNATIYYSSQDFEIDGTTLVSYKGDEPTVAVPETVTKIGAHAFEGCTGVKSVTIPETVTAIGESAFAGCTSLTAMNIPASVTSIGKWAFDGCSRLSAFTVPAGSSSFAAVNGALYNKDKTKLLRYPAGKTGNSFDIASTVKIIGDSAAVSCPNLKNVVLPSGVTTIEPYAFDKCVNLSSVTLPSTVTSIGNYAFRSNIRLKTIVLLAKSPKISGNAFLSDSVSTVCYAGSSSQWSSGGLSGLFDSQTTVYFDYSSPVITLQPQSRNAVAGKSITLSIKATGSGLTYQWYFRKAGQTTWSVWNGHTSASENVVPNDTWNGIQLYCKVTDAAGVTLNSSSMKITLTQGIVITAQPESAFVERGKTTTLSVRATGDGLTYQWYFMKKTQTAWSVWKGHTHDSESVLPNDTWDGIRLYCLIRDNNGDSVKSDVITITLRDPLKITAQPQSRTIRKGSSMTLSVRATGTGLRYQWYFKKKGQTAWTLWKGRTGASETVTPNDTWDGIQLYCLIRDISGASVKSGAATIRFGTPLAIVTQPTNQTATAGIPVTLSFKAQGTELKYQWYFKKKGQTAWTLWNGRTGASETVTPNATWDGIQLYCLVTDGAGAKVKTNVITVTLTISG